MTEVGGWREVVDRSAGENQNLEQRRKKVKVAGKMLENRWIDKGIEKEGRR